jgi:hypothetical protein
MIKGEQGQFELELLWENVSKFEMPNWQLAVSAEGYEDHLTQKRNFDEGDQELEIRLEAGGPIKGSIFTPTGEPAKGAQLASRSNGNSVSSFESGKLQFRPFMASPSDAEGRFELKKEPGKEWLVVFHESGWAIVKLEKNKGPLKIRLNPWAKVEGTCLIQGQPAPGRKMVLHRLNSHFQDPVFIFYQTTADQNGKFSFDKMIAGHFVISLETTKRLQDNFATELQTPVTLEAGETQTVVVSSEGIDVRGRLTAQNVSDTFWTNVVAILTRETGLGAPPSRNNFVSNKSHSAATERYFKDSKNIELMKQKRDFVGIISDREELGFSNIPPGNYTLEITAFRPPEKGSHTFQKTHFLRQKITIHEEPSEMHFDLGQLRLDEL